MDFPHCYGSRRVRAKHGASKCNSHDRNEPSSAERRYGNDSISITVLISQCPAVLVRLDGLAGQIVRLALRPTFIGITASDTFWFVHPGWLGQCENLQQDFREPLRRPGWRAHLCYRRHRLRILSGSIFEMPKGCTLDRQRCVVSSPAGIGRLRD